MRSEDERRAEAEWACPLARSEDVAASAHALAALRPEQRQQVQPVLPLFRERVPEPVQVRLVQQRPEPVLRDEGQHFPMTK